MSRELPTWSEMFPQGRTVFYEGDDPQGFVAEMKAKFGFDPSTDEGWGEILEPAPGYPYDKVLVSYQFHCPGEHMDAVYGGDYPLGS